MQSANSTLTLPRCFDIVEAALRKEWVRNFLLNPSTTSDLSILTSKTHIHHSIVGKVSADYPLSDTVRFANLIEANLLIVPAFCFESYSAFIFLKERANPLSTDDVVGIPTRMVEYMRRLGPSFTRIVRDESTGTWVGIDMDDHKYHAEIMVAVLDSNARIRQRASFRAPKAMILRRDFASMRATVEVFSHLTEHLNCTSCSPENTCFCVLTQPALPSHPLDLQTNMHNSKSIQGIFTAVCTLQPNSFLAAVANLANEKLSLVCNSRGGNEPGTFGRLHSWALSLAVTKSFVHPSRAPISSELIAQAYRTIAGYLSDTNEGQFSSRNNTTGNNYFATTDNTSTDPFETTLNIQDSQDQDQGFINTLLDIEPVAIAPSAIVAPAISVPMEVPALTFPPASAKESVIVSAPTSFTPPTTILPLMDGKNARPLEATFVAPELDSREAKAMRRKLKNRESAARSNQKRSQKIASLKQANAEARLQKIQLALKLEELENTNRALRQQVQASNKQQKTITAQIV